MSTAAIPMGIRAETSRKRPVSKKRYAPLKDIEIQFMSVIIISLVYLLIVVNPNISANIKGTFLILAAMTLMALFWDSLEKVIRKWWHRSFIGFNTIYFLDPQDKSLKEIIVPRWHVFHTELPLDVLAISVPLGGFLNTSRVISEYEEVPHLWRVRKRADIQTSIQHVQLIDQFKDGVSLPVDQALLFLESKQRSLEFFPNWMQEFQDMHELIADLAAELNLHAEECREEYVNTLRAEIERYKAEHAKLREAQRKLSVIINKSTQRFSPQQFIELIIRAFMAQTSEEYAREEEAHMETQPFAQDDEASAAA